MKQEIELETHEHSTLIEVVRTPKRLFYMALAIWAFLAAGLVFVLHQHWIVLCFGAISIVVGIGWASAYPEYIMRRLKD